MEILSSFPWFEIYISHKNDGNFRDWLISPEIIRPMCQIHKTNIHEITSENKDIPFSEYDGIYTTVSDITIASLCADCPVIILMGSGECATLHSGWRGTKEHIVDDWVKRFHTPREDIQVYIWPHIHADSYEVQSDFLIHFPRPYFRVSGEKIYFDIVQYIVDDLISLGILESNIIISHIDTFFSFDHFSYRKSGMIWLGMVGVKMLP